MKIDFYYQGCMCPIAKEIIHRLEQSSKLEVNLHDITNNPELCKQKQIYFPFLTVIDDQHRYYAPLNRK